MSHPIPGHSYGENEYGDVHKPKALKKHKTIKDLKEMISEPASKEWFKKHGLPKSKHTNPARSKALYNKQRKEEEKGEQNSDFDRGN